MQSNFWHLDKFTVDEEITVKIKTIRGDKESNHEQKVTPADLEKYGSIAPRFLYK